jgi:hypothetical protein
MLGYTTKDEKTPSELGTPESQTCLGLSRVGVKL